MLKLIGWIVIAFAFVDSAVASNKRSTGDDEGLQARLPTPAGLEDDVRFWEKIFEDYGPDECVFHDEWNLDVIYYVATVPRVKGSSNKLLKRHVRNIKDALSNLKRQGRPSTDLERKIYQALPADKKNYGFYAEAIDQVRCQRGVEFHKSLARSRVYVPMIKRVLREKGLPEDLAYLPHLESGFNRHATSRVGAKGLWQFMPHTARAEGLTVKRKKDLRIDPERSTDAATDHLASIFLRTQSWELAITAYNYGPNGVMRAIQKFGPDYMKIRDEHKTRLFGFAARNYYPSFLAVRNVAIREQVKLARQSGAGANIAVGEDDDSIGKVTF
jgi:membrane-bound lytic murein transglycosylase D